MEILLRVLLIFFVVSVVVSPLIAVGLFGGARRMEMRAEEKRLEAMILTVPPDAGIQEDWTRRYRQGHHDPLHEDDWQDWMSR